MPTFIELQTRLQQARFRKAILAQLIEYLDKNFVPNGDAAPKAYLLTDEQVKVPPDVFESVIADTLTAELQQLDAEINQILCSTLAPQPAPEPEPVLPEAAA